MPSKPPPDLCTAVERLVDRRLRTIRIDRGTVPARRVRIVGHFPPEPRGDAWLLTWCAELVDEPAGAPLVLIPGASIDAAGRVEENPLLIDPGPYEGEVPLVVAWDRLLADLAAAVAACEDSASRHTTIIGRAARQRAVALRRAAAVADEARRKHGVPA